MAANTARVATVAPDGYITERIIPTTIGTRDSFVRALRDANVSEEAAEREATLRYGADRDVRMAASKDARDEKTEQRAITKLYRAHGFVVRSTSQARASKVAPGLPDLIVMCPARGIAFWHEVKTSRGKLSPDQVQFRDDALACGWDFVSGDERAARSKLIALGFTQVPV